MRPNLLGRAEPTNASGAPLLSGNHLALLQGLYDRPNGYAPSSAELIRAGIPHVRAFRSVPSHWCLAKALSTLHPAWVAKRRNGSCVTWTLTERGRSIIERTVLAHIRGVGVYRGMAALRERSKARSQADCLSARLLRASSTPQGRDDIARAGAVMFVWCVFHTPRDAADVRIQSKAREAIGTYVHQFALNSHRTPAGRRLVSQYYSPCPLVVDFDELTGPLQTTLRGLSVENLGTTIVFRAATGALAAQLWNLSSPGAEWNNGGLTCDPTVAWNVIASLLGELP